jgi:MFS family permease
MAAPLGSAILAPIYQLVIDTYGWRAVFVLLGVLTLAALCPLATLLVRPPPADLGAEGRVDPRLVQRGPRADWSSSRALRTSAVWLLALALLCANLATGSVGLNLAAALTDQGVSAAAASTAAGGFALAGAAASLAWGVLAERVPARWLLTAAEIAAAGAVVALPTASTAVQGIELAVTLGVAARGQQALATILIADYYGPRAFGALAGVVLAAQTVALGLGPLAASTAYDLTGSYRDAFHALGIAYLAAAALVCAARRPHLAARPLP